MRKLIEFILRLGFFLVLLLFVVLNICARFIPDLDITPYIPILFGILILDIFFTFMFYIYIARYLSPGLKKILILASSIVLIFVLILFVIGVMTGNLLLYLIIFIIGLVSMIIFTSILRKKSGKRKKKEDINMFDVIEIDDDKESEDINF